MLRIILTISLLILFTCFAACSTEDRSTVNPTGTTNTSASADPEISYGEGFSDLETGGGSSWRWMGSEGVIKLKNAKKDMRLRIMGSVPTDRVPQSTLTITFNGQQLDQFPGSKAIDKEYSIPAAKQNNEATSELRIKADKTFVPKEVDKSSTDDRKLGFSLTKIIWEPKQ